MANTGATANLSIKPSDGWVAATSASTTFFKASRFPEAGAFYVTSASSAPASQTVQAFGTLTFSGIPVADETITIGTTTYTFKASASSATEVTIGADAATTITNLAAKVTAHSTDVTVDSTTATTIRFQAVSTGATGNSTVLTESATNITASGSGMFTGGTTEVVGFRVDDCDEGFVVNVTNSNNYYVRVKNPQPDKDARIDLFYVLT